VSELEKKGYRVRDLDELKSLLLNPSVFRMFIRGCHYGFDLAQRHVAFHVIDLESRIRHAQDQLKKFRSAHDRRTEPTLATLRVLRDRQVVFRRLMDSLLYTIVGAKTWVVRRFLQEYKIRRVDPENLKRTVEYASELNSQDRMSFNLVTDLTTVVQIGDLISIEFPAPGRAKWAIIELKQGKVNEILSGIIEEAGGSLSAVDRELIGATFGGHGLEQAQRMIRQRSRMAEVTKILTTDRGVDLGTNREIFLTPDYVELEDCFDAIESTYTSAKLRGAGGAAVDGCLRFVAVSSGVAQGLGQLGVAHLFYHLDGKNRECRLPDPEKSSHEVEALRSVPLFIDLVEHNTKSQLGCPLFVWRNEAAVLDLLFGRIRLFAQFDLERFFELARREGIKMTWITGKEAEGIKGISRQIPGSPNAWGIRAVLEDGFTQDLFLGFVGRAIVDLTRPRELLRMIKRMPAQLEKIDQS